MIDSEKEKKDQEINAAWTEYGRRPSRFKRITSKSIKAFVAELVPMESRIPGERRVPIVQGARKILNQGTEPETALWLALPPRN